MSSARQTGHIYTIGKYAIFGLLKVGSDDGSNGRTGEVVSTKGQKGFGTPHKFEQDQPADTDS